MVIVSLHPLWKLPLQGLRKPPSNGRLFLFKLFKNLVLVRIMSPFFYLLLKTVTANGGKSTIIEYSCPL